MAPSIHTLTTTMPYWNLPVTGLMNPLPSEIKSRPADHVILRCPTQTSKSMFKSRGNSKMILSKMTHIRLDEVQLQVAPLNTPRSAAHGKLRGALRISSVQRMVPGSPHQASPSVPQAPTFWPPPQPHHTVGEGGHHLKTDPPLTASTTDPSGESSDIIGNA